MTPSWQFGAVPVSPTHSRFRLWAPAVESLSLAIAGQPLQAMKPAGDGWYELETEAPPGTRYRYALPDGTRVPDPASRAQDGDVHDDSIVVDPGAYVWRNGGWRGRPWREAVIYELHVGAFCGFRGVARQLGAIAAMGFTTIELMPIGDFPGPRNWGYDGVLPYAPDAAYGTPDDLRALVDAAHDLGLAIMLDVVYNHFGPDGNYLNAYAKDFFRDDIHTPWGAAIDFRQAAVRDYFAENAIYWLTEFRFDGLRFDAVHAIKDPDWLDQMGRRSREAVGADRIVYLVLENEDNSATHLESVFDAQWNDDAHNVLHVLLTGEQFGYYEDYAHEAATRLARVLGEGFAYQGEPAGHRDNRPRGEPSGHLPSTSFVMFLQNHDPIGNRALGERLATLVEPKALRAATALLLLGPQIPMMFMGEEYGATSPFLFFTSHAEPLADAVREGRRSEFAKFPAFADEAGRHRIPDPNAESTFDDSIALPLSPAAPRAASIGLPGFSEWVRALLHIRRNALVARLDGIRTVHTRVVGTGAVHAHWQFADGTDYVIWVNLDAEPVRIEPTRHGDAQHVLFESEPGAALALAEGELRGQSFIALLGPIA
ncbi:malto-oligosyltrehalose trehalohydrolase [soil metagenome]